MFLQTIFNGVTLGSIYALMALGYAMVFSLLEMINFSQGQIFTLGAYVCLYIMNGCRIPFFLQILFALIITAMAGIGIERITISPLRRRGADKISALITTLGMGIFIENTILLICGADYQMMRFPYEIHYFDIFGARISSLEIIIILVSLLLMAILNLYIYKSSFGIAIRACAQDTETTSLMGINVGTVIAMTFAIGSALAAAAGILVGFYYNYLEPTMGSTISLKGFTASVLGGRGLISGGVLGGFALGVIESVGSTIFSAQYRDIISFTVLILILLIKPEGILGKKGNK